MAPNCFLNNADILLSVWTHSTASISAEKGTEEGVKLLPHTRNHVFQVSIYSRRKFFRLSPHQQLSPRKQGEHVRDLLNRGLLSGEPDYFGRNEISSGGDLSHYSSASLY